MNVDIIDSWLLLPLLSIISHFSCQLMCSIRQPLFVNAITPMFIQMYCFRLYFIALYCTVSDWKGMVDIKRYTPLFSLQGDYTVNATITDTITQTKKLAATTWSWPLRPTAKAYSVFLVDTYQRRLLPHHHYLVTCCQ